MVTPTKDEIIERAFEMYQQKNHVISCNNPTINELKEEGTCYEARDELMRSEGSEALDYLQEMAAEAGYVLVKDKHASEYDHELPTYPINEILREGCFCVGGRGSGKSNLLKLLVAHACKIGVKVKIIDPCLAWRGFPLKTVKVRTNKKVLCELDRIYDVSRLSVLECQKFVSLMMARDFSEALALVDCGQKVDVLYVLEEAQNIIPSGALRSSNFSEVSRFVTQGRNFHLGYVCSSQRLSAVDASLIEISGVRYWGKLEGENNLRKARAWLSKYETWNLRNLNLGEFYLQVGSKVKLLQLPKFGDERKREETKLKARVSKDLYGERG